VPPIRRQPRDELPQLKPHSRNCSQPFLFIGFKKYVHSDADCGILRLQAPEAHVLHTSTAAPCFTGGNLANYTTFVKMKIIPNSLQVMSVYIQDCLDLRRSHTHARTH
jgi:hypothetical protein